MKGTNDARITQSDYKRKQQNATKQRKLETQTHTLTNYLIYMLCYEPCPNLEHNVIATENNFMNSIDI